MYHTKRLQSYSRLCRLRNQALSRVIDKIIYNSVNLRMDWKVLRDELDLEEIIKRSVTRPQVIFKHSTRCSISSVAKSRLDRATQPGNTDFYCLDLINFRALSDKVAEVFNVYHESPQVLVIKNGECVYDESHMGITMDEILLHTEF